MAGRRLILFVVLLIVIGAVASAIAPRDRGRPAATTGDPAAPSGAAAVPLGANVVQARLPRKAAVRARVGDVVELDVSSGASDVVEIPSLGLEEPVDPEVDGQLVFDADQPGRFPVTLRDAGTRVGTVVIRPAG